MAMRGARKSPVMPPHRVKSPILRGSVSGEYGTIWVPIIDAKLPTMKATMD